jgi:hypothetical protein
LGGETAFPLWVNAETTEQLVVKPEVGKAVLFYNQLPDGNYDERSQHAALPVIIGTKWLTNLWVWVRTENVNIYQCRCAVIPFVHELTATVIFCDMGIHQDPFMY